MKRSFIPILILGFVVNMNYGQDSAISRIPLIGEPAPKFTAESTTGKITFPDDNNSKWTILFSHPADFTAVCSSEILELAAMQKDFEKLNTRLIVISTDAHSTDGLDKMRYGILQARRAGLTKADVANTRTWKQLQKLLGR